MSARSWRWAWVRGSSAPRGPTSAKVLRGSRADVGQVPVVDKMAELFKKICPFRRAGDEDVTFVAVVALAAQIAQRAKSIQGAGHNRLRNVETARQTAHRMGAGAEVDDQQEGHLAIGQIGFARPDVIEIGRAHV